MNVTYNTNVSVDPIKLKGLFEPLIVARISDFDEEGGEKFVEAYHKALSAPQPIVPVLIDSYGGDVYTCLGLMDLLESCPKPVVTMVNSKAMSCGAALFACGSPGFRFASPSATLLVHEVSGGSGGSVTDQKIDVDEAIRLNDILLRRISKRCGQKPGFLHKLLKNQGGDCYITPQEAKKIGLVSHIGIPQLDIDVNVSFDIKH